jgi:predicted DsbA family dithiol-disulfide isomerase
MMSEAAFETPGGLARDSRLPALDVMVFADVICPWCYVGKRRLEKALAQVRSQANIGVSWLPFELNPEMPPEGMERRLYRIRKFGSWERSQELDAQLTGLGAQEGLTLRYDLMTRTPNTLDAHRLIWLAGQNGCQDAVVEALFAAYFVEGRDIGAHATLADIASRSGLEAVRVEQFLQSGEAVAEVRKYEEVAREAGITGVPAFIANRRPLFMGAQPPDVIVSALRSVLFETGS